MRNPPLLEATFLACPPNGLVFSCRERAPKTVSKNARSRARSGQLQHRVRRSGRVPSGCQPHAPTTLARYHAGTTGFHRYHAQLGSHPAPRAAIRTTPGTRSRCPERARRTTGRRTTPCTTGTPHHGPAYHTLHNARRHAGASTTDVREAQPPDYSKNGLLTTRPGRRTVWHSAGGWNVSHA